MAEGEFSAAPYVAGLFVIKAPRGFPCFVAALAAQLILAGFLVLVIPSSFMADTFFPFSLLDTAIKNNKVLMTSTETGALDEK